MSYCSFMFVFVGCCLISYLIGVYDGKGGKKSG
jgi:hypothetical protein